MLLLYHHMDTNWYNARTFSGKSREIGDWYPTLLTFSTGYLGGYLASTGVLAGHIGVCIVEQSELKEYFAKGWPSSLAPVMFSLLPVMLTAIWKKVTTTVKKSAAGRVLLATLLRERDASRVNDQGADPQAPHNLHGKKNIKR